MKEDLEDEEQYSADTENEEEAARPAASEAEHEPEGDASLDEILATKPEERGAGEEEEEEESLISLGTEDRVETLAVKVVPKQDTEFVCRKCHLVKPIRSQLADKRRMYCRDCV